MQHKTKLEDATPNETCARFGHNLAQRTNLHAGIPRFEPVVLVERVGRERLVDIRHGLHVSCAQGLALIPFSGQFRLSSGLAGEKDAARVYKCTMTKEVKVTEIDRKMSMCRH